MTRYAALLLCLIFPAEQPPLPPLGDLGLFPPHVVADRNESLARYHVRLLPGWVQSADWARWHDDAQFCRDCWETLAHAHTDAEPGQRRRLARLRDLLGAECYHRGQMPPPFPLCWYRRMD